MKIKTKRLILRTPTRDDFEFLKSMWENGEVMKFVGFPNGLKQTDEKIYQWIENCQANEKLRLVIEDKASHRAIGETGYRFDIEYPFVKGKKSVAPDIKLIPEFWGKGLATEALTALIDCIFKNTDAEIIQMAPNVKNKAALSLYKKLGFRKIGKPRIDKIGLGKNKIVPDVPVEYQYMEMRKYENHL